MSGLFRRKAVENYREQFATDSNISRLSTSAIVFSLVFVLGAVLTGVWFFCGNIVSTVEISGLVYPAAGIDTLTAVNSGVISDIKVNIGDKVSTSDIVAVVPDEDVLAELAQSENDGADEEETAALRQKYADNSIIRTKSSGTILSVSDEGSYVSIGDSVATVAARNQDDNARQILAFLPTNQKNSISVGCSVQVSPNYAPREKYGYINGYISDIDTTVITRSDVLSTMNVYNIPNMLSDEQAYIAVHINLIADEETESGLKWSIKQSGAIDVETGDMCNIYVVESSLPPYKWLFGGA